MSKYIEEPDFERLKEIEDLKEYIINGTNIEHSPNEMKVLNDICFRLCQLGLTVDTKKKSEKYDKIVEAEEKFLATVKGEKNFSKGIEFYLKLVKERDEALKRVEELEQQNKVLVDGVKDLKSYIYIFVDNEINKVIVRLNENKDFVPDEIQIGKKFNEIKAMLEVVENE